MSNKTTRETIIITCPFQPAFFITMDTCFCKPAPKAKPSWLCWHLQCSFHVLLKNSLSCHDPSIKPLLTRFADKAWSWQKLRCWTPWKAGDRPFYRWQRQRGTSWYKIVQLFPWVQTLTLLHKLLAVKHEVCSNQFVMNRLFLIPVYRRNPSDNRFNSWNVSTSVLQLRLVHKNSYHNCYWHHPKQRRSHFFTLTLSSHYWEIDTAQCQGDSDWQNKK